VKKAGCEVIYPDKQPFRDAVSGMKTKFQQSELGPLIGTVEDLEKLS
jgi:TRAP-type C4-dicarboxylate transport system substrate-binding protein